MMADEDQASLHHRGGVANEVFLTEMTLPRMPNGVPRRWETELRPYAREKRRLPE
jgi:hypothetical protein